MAVRIKRDQLTTSQIDDIKKHLFMQPKTTGFFKQKRFVAQKDPVLMWYFDKPKNEVVVPYFFGNCLLKKHINSALTYPDGQYNFKGELRPHQVPIINQAVKHLTRYGTTILGVFPGCGKTIMSTYLAAQLGGLVLVVYPIKMVEPSWLNTFKRFSDASVWHNDGKNSIPSNCNVIATMDTQFHKIPPQILSMVKVLIVDEAHMFCVASRIQCLLGVTPQYIIACTATLERRDGMESIIHSVCGTHGIFLKSPKRFSVYRLATGIKTEIEKGKNGNSDWAKLVRDLCEDPKRNAYIIDLVENNLNHKIMILTWNVNHAYFLTDMLKSRGITSDVLAGNKNTYKDSQVLVGSIGKLSTGFDEGTSCPDWGGQRSNMMILTGSTKSLQGLEQMTGRVFRAEFPTIIDLVDDNRICKSHWNQRKKWYEDPERNGEIFYVEMKQSTSEVNNKDLNNNRVKQLNKKSIERAKLRLNK